MSPKFTSKTSWRQKLERVQEAKIVDVPPRMQPQCGVGKMLIPRPLDVDALIRQVPKGKLVTVQQLRQELARQSHADVTCPLTTGIFIRIAAEAAEEARRAGQKRITPYWRVVTPEGRLNPKFPGGVTAQKRNLMAEGHRFEKSGGKKPPAISGFQSMLARLSWL